MIPCRLARYVGDHHTAEALEPIAANHPTPRIRVTALESLATLVADSARQIWHRAESDAHPLVRMRARDALAELDGSRCVGVARPAGSSDRKADATARPQA